MQDAFDSDVDLASLDDIRQSIEGDEKPQEVEADQTLSDVAGSAVDEALQAPAIQHDNVVPESLHNRVGSSGGGASAAHASKEPPASNGSQGDPDSTSVHSSANFGHIQDDKSSLKGSLHSLPSQNGTVAPHGQLNASAVVAAHPVDSSAVEIGMERYLGMAEASNTDRESILKEALRLAVSDRINTRM